MIPICCAVVRSVVGPTTAATLVSDSDLDMVMVMLQGEDLCIHPVAVE